MRFNSVPLDALEKAWNSFFPTKYAVSGDLIAEKTIRHPLFAPDLSWAILDELGAVEAMVASKQSPSPPAYDFGSAGTLHLTAVTFREPHFAQSLLDKIKIDAKTAKFHQIVFGSDLGHLFPGCPDGTERLEQFLNHNHFAAGAKSVDIERDLLEYTPPAWADKPLHRADVQVTPLHEGQFNELEAWFNREFPGRWRLDTMAKARDLVEPQDILILAVGGAIQGFAYTQDWRTKLPSAGAVWNKSLGRHWGALGPIGISKEVRGQGLGHALLAAGLVSLRDKGCRNTIIDWTTLVDFYGAHGFAVTREYVSYSLKL